MDSNIYGDKEKQRNSVCVCVYESRMNWLSNVADALEPMSPFGWFDRWMCYVCAHEWVPSIAIPPMILDEFEDTTITIACYYDFNSTVQHFKKSFFLMYLRVI